MPLELSKDIMDHLSSGDKVSQRIIDLLREGSKPNLNELCRFILAQEAFRTNDTEAQKVKDKAIKLANLKDSVLIRGESGTGKELLANILHGSRPGAFVAINTTAVTETLFESELFGHVKGSFTGAITDRPGLVSHASGGTLFFDEIGDMPLSLQPKILRLLQTRKFRMVGGNVDQYMDCRVIAATHANLEQMVEAKLFRADLFYRLNVFHLDVNPIAKRLCDLDLFVRDSKLLAELQKRASVQGDKFLPGNVRELESINRRWEVLGEM
jgi:transcriptional regulator with PAS, ATPase and Fis domain